MRGGYLTEGSRDNMLMVYLPYFEKAGIDMSLSKLKQFLLNKFVVEAGIHKLSESSNYYLAGVARYYFNGDLTSNKKLNAFYPNIKDEFKADICERLDAVIGILRLAYIDSVGTKFEQPEDFGTLSIKQLLRKYGKKIDTALGIVHDKPKAEVQENEYDHNVGNGYTYDILYSYEDAKKYRAYTEPGAWCITYGQQHYNAYVRRLGIHYVIFLMNGYENVERKVGNGYTKQKPHDLYGNSMIAVLQSNTTGEPIYITSRWNHGSYSDNTAGTEADHAYTKEEFLNVIGDDGSVLERAFKEWKEKNPKTTASVDRKLLNQNKLSVMRLFKVAQMRINNGADPFTVLKGLSPDCNVTTILANSKPKKGIYYVKLTYNGVGYCTVMDNGQLHFDEFLLNSTYYVARYTVDRGEKYFQIMTTANNTFYVYDIMHHRLLNIDGIKVIRALDTFHHVKYMLLAASGNQIALLNTDSMDTIKNKDGNSWFECIVPLNDNIISNIDYSGHIRLRTYSKGGIFLLNYDSSANEEYFYDIENGKFIDNNINVDGETLTLSVNKSTMTNSDSTFSRYVSYTDENNCIMLRDINNGEFLNILGVDKFSAAFARKSVLAFTDAEDDEAIWRFYDSITDELLSIDGNVVELKMDSYGYVMQSGCHNSNNEYLYIRANNGLSHFWRGVLIYNTKTHSFFHTKDEGYVFSMYSERKYYANGDVKRGEVKNLPTPDEMIEFMNTENKTNESKKLRKIMIPEHRLLKMRNLIGM